MREADAALYSYKGFDSGCCKHRSLLADERDRVIYSSRSDPQLDLDIRGASSATQRCTEIVSKVVVVFWWELRSRLLALSLGNVMSSGLPAYILHVARVSRLNGMALTMLAIKAVGSRPNLAYVRSTRLRWIRIQYSRRWQSQEPSNGNGR